MASDVLANLQAELIRQFKVQGVPPLNIAGGISPTVVMSALNPIGCLYDAENSDYDTSVAPAASTVLAETGGLPAGNYDLGYAISAAPIAADRYVTLSVYPVASGGSAIFSIPFFFDGTIQQRGEICLVLGEDWSVRFIVGGTNFAAGEVISTLLIWNRRTVT